MSVQTGLERILKEENHLIKGARVGLICNPSAIDRNIAHAVDLFHQHPDINLKTIFGPQHGARADEQDNMIESADMKDPQTGLVVYSLYSTTRKPTEKMVQDVDVLVFDIQDVGSRYYTFIYTMALAMEACVQFGKKMVILDRPNPIGGDLVQGNVLNAHLKSFVGMFPIATRHGMTVGELALMFRDEFDVKCELEVVKMSGWKRSMYYEETGLPWVLPSPNMPTVETAVVYPGMCLLEATNLSEGRGTTRPFEIIGAPFVDPWVLVPRVEKQLADCGLNGCHFRPCYFKPTFNKWHNKPCGGFQVHVLDRKTFDPYMMTLAVLLEVRKLYGENLFWKDPPYEYEYDKLPFDILSGDVRIREYIDAGRPLKEFPNLWREELEDFKKKREKYLLYR